MSALVRVGQQPPADDVRTFGEAIGTGDVNSRTRVAQPGKRDHNQFDLVKNPMVNDFAFCFF